MVKAFYISAAGKLRGIVIITLLVAGTLLGQETGSVTGHVKDAQSGDPLIGVNLIIKGTNLGAATDIEGNYKIVNVSAGKHILLASYVGYQVKTIDINVQANKSVEVNFELSPQAIQGKEVLVTAQAKGQLSAINQQLSSNNIVNVVSAEKMKELPDANIAESIGRLPGISLQRNAGEAYAVVVRGLSPQYNEVTIEGVPMSSTNYYDRSIDLSLLSDNLVQGVEVSKTLRADMDANALGGTINLTLRTADPGLHYNIWANGGYNHLRNSYDNYKITGSISDRFLDNKVGVLFQGNLEKKQLPSDQFNATYATPIYDPNTNQFSVSTQTAELTDNTTKRNRYGLSLILDYESDLVNVKFYNVYDQKNDSILTRDYSTQFTSNSFYDQIFVNETKTAQETHSLQALFKLGSTELPVSISYTKGSQNVPAGLEADFYQTNVTAPSASQLIYGTPSSLINTMGVMDATSPNTTFYNFLINNTNLTSEQYDGRIDWKVPFKLSDSFGGTISVGGKYHKMNRTSSNDRVYYNLLYGGSNFRRINLMNAIPWLAGDENVSAGLGAAPFIDHSYNRTSILGYPIGPGFNINKLTEIKSLIYPDWLSSFYDDGVASYNQNYFDHEDSYAGYIMGEFNIGKNLILVPGVRYQEERTDISAYHIIANYANQNGLIGFPVLIDTKRDFVSWYPSINIKYKATDNVQIRGAVYKSESLPSFGDILPMIVYQSNTPIVTGNPLLKPSTAWNYDLNVSLFDNYIGLFTVDGFYKEISNLIYPMQNYYPFSPYPMVNAPSDIFDRLPGRSYYDTSWAKANSAGNLNSAIPMNDPEKAFLRGVEFSWQTHLWYLPGLLNGIVLDLNLSLMSSNQAYPTFRVVKTGGTVFNPQNSLVYTTTESSLQNQPKAIYNAIIGWDYEGFSSRVSFRYQEQTLTSIDTKYGLENSYYDNVLLVDISLKQKIISGLSLFANATNINNHVDNYYYSHPAYINQGYVYNAGRLPTSGQTYGWALEFGATYSY